MGLRAVAAAPFVQHGRRRIGESEFVVALSLDRDWFSPDQAKRLLDLACSEGLLSREDGEVVAGFDVEAVDVPSSFEPDESLLSARSPFERALAALVEAGHDKRDAVAAVNRLQERLGVTVEAAAVVYAGSEGIDVGPVADAVRASLFE